MSEIGGRKAGYGSNAASTPVHTTALRYRALQLGHPLPEREIDVCTDRLEALLARPGVALTPEEERLVRLIWQQAWYQRLLYGLEGRRG